MLLENFAESAKEGTRGFGRAPLRGLPVSERAIQIGIDAVWTACNTKAVYDRGGGEGDPPGYVVATDALVALVVERYMLLAAHVNSEVLANPGSSWSGRGWYGRGSDALGWQNADGTLAGWGIDYTITTARTLPQARAKKTELCQHRLAHLAEREAPREGAPPRPAHERGFKYTAPDRLRNLAGFRVLFILPDAVEVMEVVEFDAGVVYDFEAYDSLLA